MTINKSDLRKHGYNEFADTIYHADAFFQKCVKDKLGKKYFINFYLYHDANSDFNAGEYHFEVRLGFNTNYCYLDVAMVSFETNDIAKIEEYVRYFFELNKGVYYEYYEEE